MKNFVEKTVEIIKKVATKKNLKKLGKGTVAVAGAVAIEAYCANLMVKWLDANEKWINNTK